MSMRIGSKVLLTAVLGYAVLGAVPEAYAAGAGAIGGGFGSSGLGGGAVAGRGGFVGGNPYGYRGHRQHGWRGAYGYGWQHGRGGYGHHGHGRGRFGYGYGYGAGYGYGYGTGFAYGAGGGYPVEPPPPNQPVVGIPPSPVAPPAIYVIGSKAKGSSVRKGAKRSLSARSASVAGRSSGVVVTRMTPEGYQVN